MTRWGVVLVASVLLASFATLATPPFYGTIGIDPDIILPTDPSAFLQVSYVRRDARTLFDRRTGLSDRIERVHILIATFDDGDDIEFRVHPEFAAEASAEAAAARYAYVIGQLPYVLRRRLRSVAVLMGVQPFGGDARHGEILIHTGQARQYENEGILEETLVHEACHVSLDVLHARAGGWIAAQQADGEFISIYARDHPVREDVAESFLPYYAVRYRSDRISAEMLRSIEETIPHRIAYFDEHVPLGP